MTIITAYLDLDVCPVSFDAVVFMVKAEMERKRVGAARLHVVIVPGKGPGGFRDKSQFYDQHEARWRLWNICIPACALVGATVTLAADWKHASRLKTDAVWPPDWNRQTLKDRRHLVGDIIQWSRAGVDVPRLQASEHARRKVRELYARRRGKVITFTVRNTYLPERNTQWVDAMAAAKHMANKGYWVEIIKDTGAALSDGQGFGELNLDLRMAMYQEAALNFVESNGPASLCWFSDRPYRMFGAGIPAEEWHGLFVKQGLPLGTNWPWAGPEQRLIYQRSSKDALIAEFESWASATS